MLILTIWSLLHSQRKWKTLMKKQGFFSLWEDEGKYICDCIQGYVCVGLGDTIFHFTFCTFHLTVFQLFDFCLWSSRSWLDSIMQAALASSLVKYREFCYSKSRSDYTGWKNLPFIVSFYPLFKYKWKFSLGSTKIFSFPYFCPAAVMNKFMLKTLVRMVQIGSKARNGLDCNWTPFYKKNYFSKVSSTILQSWELSLKEYRSAVNPISIKNRFPAILSCALYWVLDGETIDYI